MTPLSNEAMREYRPLSIRTTLLGQEKSRHAYIFLSTKLQALALCLVAKIAGDPFPDTSDWDDDIGDALDPCLMSQAFSRPALMLHDHYKIFCPQVRLGDQGPYTYIGAAG